MKMVILAAGVGKRLRPLTNDMPKCMVEYQGRAIIDSILEVAKQCNIQKIAVVNGYKKEVLQKFLENENIVFFTNEDYDKTNMIYSLYCAKDFMDDDLIISYADIVYKKDILEKLINSKDDFSVVVDRKWRSLWEKRMDNPLDDAETLKLENGEIVEIGKKPNDYSEIEGQFIGLFKVSKKSIVKVFSFLKGLDFRNIYTTDFIQILIDSKVVSVKPVFIDGGWIEIDTLQDLKI